MTVLSVADAIVALRSFPRRFRELIGPPGDDDAWDRLVRTVGPGQERSALGWAARAARELAVLGQAIAALPTHSTVTCSLHQAAAPLEVPTTTAVDAVLNDLTTASTMAAVTSEARITSDWDRKIVVDGTAESARDLLTRVVPMIPGHLREIGKALDAARAR